MGVNMNMKKYPLLSVSSTITKYLGFNISNVTYNMYRLKEICMILLKYAINLIFKIVAHHAQIYKIQSTFSRLSCIRLVEKILQYIVHILLIT